ncbi:hypothetical protein GWI33_008036 [Rhynchophorus ferrugineus]|uniref:Uncharacterized protein n=1 Tax=Rhynchophorus ferrugineus TaxID=354439 RepID=A0A834MCI0_RHYFE|nr:hypothetical protein GWI33_008036 [Rhynchophorus ferrugineus]
MQHNLHLVPRNSINLDVSTHIRSPGSPLDNRWPARKLERKIDDDFKNRSLSDAARRFRQLGKRSVDRRGRLRHNHRFDIGRYRPGMDSD